MVVIFACATIGWLPHFAPSAPPSRAQWMYGALPEECNAIALRHPLHFEYNWRVGSSWWLISQSPLVLSYESSISPWGPTDPPSPANDRGGHVIGLSPFHSNPLHSTTLRDPLCNWVLQSPVGSFLLSTRAKTSIIFFIRKYPPLCQAPIIAQVVRSTSSAYKVSNFLDAHSSQQLPCLPC